MQMQSMVAVCFAAVLGAALWLAYKYGQKAAQLEAARASARQNAQEQQYVQGITARVHSLSGDDARRRLHEISNQQR